jgi:hypothetical protein
MLILQNIVGLVEIGEVLLVLKLKGKKQFDSKIDPK